MIRLGVFFVGKSGEHEVSLLSAASVLRAINREKYTPVMIGISKDGRFFRYEGEVENIENGQWQKDAQPIKVDDLPEIIDFALPILHGTFGEDGTIQGLFEMLNLPYAGCGVLGSASAMDKLVAKELFVSAGIPSCRYTGVISSLFEEKDAAAIAEKVGGYPCFVKPANLGSSVGISKATNEAELIEAVKLAARYDRRIIVEEGMNIREIEAAVIGNDVPFVGAVGEIVPSADYYDYKAKYLDGQSVMVIPAQIPQEKIDQVKEYAVRAYKALDLAGLSRIDFFMDKETGEIYINEVNTLPGFTKFSMFPGLMAEAGVPYPELIERIVDYGYERYNAKNSRETSI
ncbi:MAG: D-alanine--D-alanine ligase [Firmicutes bacterium]|nr:D-alanine--D-alanine ligase [Bacillota bacterium]